MKALSVKSPHAQRIALGQKTMEIRSWEPNYTGPLLICVSKRAGTGQWAAGSQAVDRGLPPADCLGMAICVVDVVGCRRMLPGDEADACHPYQPGHYVWKLANVRTILPFPVRGKLKFFSVAESLIQFRRTSEDRLSFPHAGFPPSQRTESRSSFALRQ